MSILADCHLHSSFSGDCNIPMETMLCQGIKNGLSYFCMTEHFDPDYPIDPDTPPGYFDLDTSSYHTEYLRLRNKYHDKIHFLYGVELGMQPHLGTFFSEYTAKNPFDFVIASSHLCNHMDPYYPAFFEGRSEESAYNDYFASILKNLEAFSDFDVYGHLDYVVRYGPNKDAAYSYSKYQDILDAILQKILDMGKGIELNMGGLKYGLKNPNPSLSILKRYKELGGEILTIGSDAHKPEHIAYAFDRASDFLKECGFFYYTVYKNRKPIFLSL